MSTGLTGKQASVLTYIRAYIRERGYPPTVREVALHLGGVSTNAAQGHLVALERKGWLRRTPGVSRGRVPT